MVTPKGLEAGPQKDQQALTSEVFSDVGLANLCSSWPEVVMAARSSLQQLHQLLAAGETSEAMRRMLHAIERLTAAEKATEPEQAEHLKLAP